MINNDYHHLMSLSYTTPDDTNDKQSECFMIYENLFSDEECDDILEHCLSLPEAEGLVGRPVVGYVTDYDLRKCGVTYLPRLKDNLWFLERCEQALTHANDSYWRFDVKDFSQPARLMTYHENDHFQSWHQDNGPGLTRHRKLTIVVQLDHQTAYEGGQFEMAGRHLPNTYGPRGSAIVFPSYQQHRVSPITSGLRRSLVHRAIGPSFR